MSRTALESGLMEMAERPFKLEELMYRLNEIDLELDNITPGDFIKLEKLDTERSKILAAIKALDPKASVKDREQGFVQEAEDLTKKLHDKKEN